jgi:hypothetical protein
MCYRNSSRYTVRIVLVVAYCWMFLLYKNRTLQ